MTSLIDLKINYNHSISKRKENEFHFNIQAAKLKTKQVERFNPKDVTKFLDFLDIEYDWSDDLILYFPEIVIKSNAGNEEFIMREMYVKIQIELFNIKIFFLKAAGTFIELHLKETHPHISGEVGKWSNSYCMGSTPYAFSYIDLSNELIGFIYYLREFLAHEEPRRPYIKLSSFLKQYANNDSHYYIQFPTSQYKDLNYRIINKQGRYIVEPIIDEKWRKVIDRLNSDKGYMLDGGTFVPQNKINPILLQFNTGKNLLKFKGKNIKFKVLFDLNNMVVNPVVQKKVFTHASYEATRNFYEFCEKQLQNSSKFNNKVCT